MCLPPCHMAITKSNNKKHAACLFTCSFASPMSGNYCALPCQPHACMQYSYLAISTLYLAQHSSAPNDSLYNKYVPLGWHYENNCVYCSPGIGITTYHSPTHILFPGQIFLRGRGEGPGTVATKSVQTYPQRYQPIHRGTNRSTEVPTFFAGTPHIGQS